MLQVLWATISSKQAPISNEWGEIRNSPQDCLAFGLHVLALTSHLLCLLPVFVCFPAIFSNHLLVIESHDHSQCIYTWLFSILVTESLVQSFWMLRHLKYIT